MNDAAATAPLELNDKGEVILPRDRFFDPWRVAIGENANKAVEDVTGQLLNYETYYKVRKRKRRQADLDTFKATVEAIVCDMMLAVIDGDDRGTAISLSNQVLGIRSRYRPPSMGKQLRTALILMTKPEMAFITVKKGEQKMFANRGQRTLIWPTRRIIERVEDYDVDEEDIGKRREAEVIILKRTKHDYWDDGGYEEYADNDTTRRYRSEIEEINAFLEQASITVEDLSLKVPRRVPIHQRRLRRIFTRGSFTSGGRLFDGFWQSMEKEDRINAIRIDGERVVELDYGQMAPRLIYGLAGKTPPDRDLYAIDGIDPSYRDGVKKLFNAMLFTDKPLTKKPKGTKALLPKTPVDVLSKMVIACHPDMEPYFHSDDGHYVQFVESEIMVRVLLTLKDQGIVGLPVHDGLLVKRGEAEKAREVMEKVGEEKGGVSIPVEVGGM